MEEMLIIDDDVALCELVTEYLEPLGFKVHSVHRGNSGAETALAGNFSIVILDVMLPVLNGFEVLKTIRAQSKTPVLMLTARGDDVDRIVGLEIGADDYLPKPFNPRELVARIRAILRRTGSEPSSSVAAKPLVVGDIELDRRCRSGWHNRPGRRLLAALSNPYGRRLRHGVCILGFKLIRSDYY